MQYEDFKRIYIDFGKKEFSNEVFERVKKCMFPFEERNVYLTQGKIRRRISTEQAVSDVKDFFYCMKLCYSGYDYFFSDELSSQIQNNLINNFEKRFKKQISNELLCKYLHRSLKPVIQESHMDFVSGRFYFSFAKPYLAYVSDLILKKVKEGYLVVKGNCTFKENQIFEDKEVNKYLLPTLCPDKMEDKEDRFFLLGIYSNEKMKSIHIKNKKIRLHRIRSDFLGKSEKQNLVDCGKYVVANHPTYSLDVKQEITEEFYKQGKICSEKPVTVLNVAGNLGGNDYFPSNFFMGFSGSDYQNLITAKLKVNLENEIPVKEYEIIHFGKDKPKGNYDGQLFVVMNKSTASSGEAPVEIARHLPGTIFAGSATCGCGTFGDCLYYQLPNSKIIFRLGFKLFYHEGFEEGKGYLPDYWIDDKNPVRVIEEYIDYVVIC